MPEEERRSSRGGEPGVAGGKGMNKSRAARAAIDAGYEKPVEAVAYIKRQFGIDMNPQHFSSIKSNYKKAQGEAKPGKAVSAPARGRKVASPAVEGYVASAAQASGRGGLARHPRSVEAADRPAWGGQIEANGRSPGVGRNPPWDRSIGETCWSGHAPSGVWLMALHWERMHHTRVRWSSPAGIPATPNTAAAAPSIALADLGHPVVLLYLNDGVPPGSRRTGCGSPRRARRARSWGPGRSSRGRWTARRSSTGRITRRSARSSTPSSPTWSSPTGRSTTTPTTGRSRCWSTTPGCAMGRRVRPVLLRGLQRRGHRAVRPDPLRRHHGRPSRGNAGPASPTPASRPEVLRLQEQVTRFRGIERGVRHAEGFIRHIQSPDFPLPPAL